MVSLHTIIYACLAILSTWPVQGASIHVKIHESPHKAKESVESKHLYHIKGDKRDIGNLLAKKTNGVDVWNVQAQDDMAVVDVHATKKDAENLVHSVPSHAHHHAKGYSHGRKHKHVKLWEDEMDEEEEIARDRREVKACLDDHGEDFVDEVQTEDYNYTASSYFECFRPYDQTYHFFDTLAEANPDLMTKEPNISTTYEGRPIHAYRISISTEKKKSLYIQALIHPREWQAGASTAFATASLVMNWKHGEQDAVKALEEFDWYIVPIVNVDGYIYSWEKDRLWRTNRDMEGTLNSGEHVGVDLNRNFGPDEFYEENIKHADDETYPGEHPLSEPSSEGIMEYLRDVHELSGVIDMHSFGGEVLRPFSDQSDGMDKAHESKLKHLGDAVANVMGYESKTGADLYLAYGCFDDGVSHEFNLTVPAVTFEVEGDFFTAKQSTIRDVGGNVYQGWLQFAKEALDYKKFIDSL